MRGRAVLLEVLLAVALALPATGPALAGGSQETELVLSTSQREGGNGTLRDGGGMRLSTGGAPGEEHPAGPCANRSRPRADGIDWLGVEIEIPGLEPRLRFRE
jgi:hypothetical protein